MRRSLAEDRGPLLERRAEGEDGAPTRGLCCLGNVRESTMDKDVRTARGGPMAIIDTAGWRCGG